MRLFRVVKALFVPAAAVLLSLALAESVQVGAAQTSAGRAGKCSEVALDRRPGWTISGAWQGDTLVVVDAFSNELLGYSDTGESLGPVAPALSQALEGFTPSVLKNDPESGGLMLELASARLVRLNRSLAPVGLHDVTRESRSSSESLEGVFQWDLAAGDLVLFGDVRRSSSAGDEWKSGFFRVSLNRPRDLQSLYEIEPTDLGRVHYRLGSPLIASLGDRSYILLMEEKPRIAVSRKGSSRLEPLQAFPPGFETRPTLPPWRELQEYASLMGAVERSAMPTGLFAWEDHLYVMGRRPDPGRAGSTLWTVTKIDPRADTIVWTTTIPLPKAHHVTVVPGPRQWAFLEKSSARGLFNQDTTDLFLVPSSAFRGVPGNDICR
jgi:hypothetical protein